MAVCKCSYTVATKVELLCRRDTSPQVYETLEIELFALMQDDEYFSSLPEMVRQEECQTLGHMLRDREISDLLPTSDAVSEMFGQQRQAIERMDSLCKSVATACSDWKANKKALDKAKQQEMKAQKALEERERKKQVAKEAKAQKKVMEDEQKAKEKAEADAADPEHGKKRRVSSRLASELSESDPCVLRDRFPTHQLPVVDDLETWL